MFLEQFQEACRYQRRLAWHRKAAGRVVGTTAVFCSCCGQWIGGKIRSRQWPGWSLQSAKRVSERQPFCVGANARAREKPQDRSPPCRQRLQRLELRLYPHCQTFLHTSHVSCGHRPREKVTLPHLALQFRSSSNCSDVSMPSAVTLANRVRHLNDAFNNALLGIFQDVANEHSVDFNLIKRASFSNVVAQRNQSKIVKRNRNSSVCRLFKES